MLNSSVYIIQRTGLSDYFAIMSQSKAKHVKTCSEDDVPCSNIPEVILFDACQM